MGLQNSSTEYPCFKDILAPSPVYVWVCGVWDGYGQRLGLYGVWRGWYGGGGVMLSNLICVGLGHGLCGMSCNWYHVGVWYGVCANGFSSYIWVK